MPKPLKKTTKRSAQPADVNQLARYLVEQTTGERDSTIPPAVSAYMSAIGTKGGKIGGKRRMETMTHEQRSAIALKAVKKRWENDRKRRAKKR